MQTQISDEIIKIIEYLSEKFGIAYSTVENELFPCIKEIGDKLINYEICTSVVWIVISVIVLTLCATIFKKIIKSNSENKDWIDDDFDSIMLIISIILGVAFSLVMFQQIFDIVECVTCPEKYILDYIMNYTKNKQ